MELCDNNERCILSVCLLLRHTFLFQKGKRFMNNQQLISTKKLHEAIKKLLGEPHLQILFMRQFPDIKFQLEDLLFIEPLRFMLYVSTADNHISQRELNVVNYITGKYLTLDDVNELVSENRDFYIDSMPQVPLMVKVCCEVENELYKTGESLETSVLEILITYFEALGDAVADSDDNITYAESDRIESYIALIKSYATENTLSPFCRF